MTMNNFDLNHLADTPGVVYKRFCTFSCTTEAEGDMQMEFDGDVVSVPVCGRHAKMLLDSGKDDVID